MDTNLEKILALFEELKGQFVLDDKSVERLIAIGTDDEDYYYVLYDGRKVIWSSCVGKIVPLKGFLKDEDYNEFKRLALLNNWAYPSFYGNNPNDIIPEKLVTIFIDHLHKYLSSNQIEIENITYGEFCQLHRKMIETATLPDKYLTEVCWDLN